MLPRARLLVISALAAWLSSGRPADAVIRVDLPVSRIYASAGQVLVGTVTAVRPANGLVAVKVREAIKGRPASDRLRVQIVRPPTLIGRVAVGGTAVLFVGSGKDESVAVAHLADTWLLAKGIGGAGAGAWRVVQRYDARQSFPGPTAALVGIVRELKAGGVTFLDKTDPVVFRGGIRRLGKLDVAKPDSLLAVDVNADRKPDLVVGAGGKVRLFLAAAGGFEDATTSWALARAAGPCRAHADVNGDDKADLLLGRRLWLNRGGKFVAAKDGPQIPGTPRPLAAGLADVTGDGRADALLVSADGRLTVLENPAGRAGAWRARPPHALWQAEADAPPAAAAFGDWAGDAATHLLVVRPSGITRYALGAPAAAKATPADFTTLVGVDLKRYYARYRGGLRNASAVALDLNGDSRLDLLTVCDGGGLALVNRGFGAFLCDYDAGSPLTSRKGPAPPFKLTPSVVWTAADLHGDGFDDLLVLTPDGRLYEAHNRPTAAQKAFRRAILARLRARRR